MGWIGVDLDRTLATYNSGDYRDKGPLYIGAPIKRMVDRVKLWLRQGKEVRIFTARAADEEEEVIAAIKEWCLTHIGQELEVTCKKDFEMIALFDDLAFGVEPNTGRVVVSPYVSGGGKC